jgi:hypothetical protein
LVRAEAKIAATKARATAYYDRHARDWAAGIFANDSDSKPPCIALHPPIERQALSDGHAASTWAQSWKRPAYAEFVTWDRFVRELPVRGVDTKWLETHRALVEPKDALRLEQERIESGLARLG